IPKHILQAQALDRRSSGNHPFKDKISKRAMNRLSGYKGEQSMDFHLQFLPEDYFFIFHYVRLPDEYGYFQLDFLLLSHHFFLIMEVKNIHLNMNFDNMGQAFRNRDGEVELFENPVEQVNLQHIRLLNWLRKYNFPPVPIEKIVVYSRDDTYLRNIANDKVISAIVMHRDKVIPKIKSFMKKYQSPLISETELMELSYQLLKEQKDEADDGMNKFNISYNDLVKGVFCTKCGTFPIMWKNGLWRCHVCGTTSKKAHLSTLADYALLVKIYINNREMREFSQLKSVYTAKRLLQQEGFEQYGSTSGRRYKINLEKLLEAEVHI